MLKTAPKEGSDLLKKIVIIASMLLAAVLFFASCGSKGKSADIKTQIEDLYRDSEDGSASFYAVYDLADKYGYDYNTEAFRTLCGEAVANDLLNTYHGNTEARQKDLDDFNMSYELYEKIIEQDTLKTELYTYLIDKGVIESDPEILREKFLAGEAVYVKRILVKFGETDEEKSAAYETIERAEEQLAEGKSFEEVKSLLYEAGDAEGDPASCAGGYIIVRGIYDFDYEDACFSLEVGETSEAFDTTVGYCIVKRLELKPELLDEFLDETVTSYTEGQFGILLDEAGAARRDASGGR